jgi:hypothetical protein
MFRLLLVDLKKASTIRRLPTELAEHFLATHRTEIGNAMGQAVVVVVVGGVVAKGE